MNSHGHRTKSESQWPFIRFAEREKKWKVDARTKTGGSRRFFVTKAEAETFAMQCRIQRGNEGTAAFGNADLEHYGKTIQDAVQFYVAHLRQQENSVSVTIGVAEFIRLKEAAHKSVRYVKDLGLRLGRFMKTHGDRAVTSVTGKELDAWLTGLAVAPGTRNTFRRDLRTFFSFCEKRGYTASNPAKGTERAHHVDKPPEILTVAQATALLKACKSDTLPYVAISLFAGLRAAEMEKLDWSEVDIKGGHLEVTAKKAKTAQRRLVPIAKNLAAWIRPHVKKSGPVAPQGLRKRFDAAKSRAGLSDWPPNAMRHSFASYRLAQCHDAAKVSLEMGNSPAMVFAHYRELVRPKAAVDFWEICPGKNKCAGKL